MPSPPPPAGTSGEPTAAPRLRVAIVGAESGELAALERQVREAGAETARFGALPAVGPEFDLALLDRGVPAAGGASPDAARSGVPPVCLLAPFAGSPPTTAETSGLWDVLYLPAAAGEIEDLLARARELAADRLAGSPLPRRVLVVDDEQSIRDAAADLLRGRGFRVDTAVDGLEALGRLQVRAYDLVVTDLQMPGIDGVALLGRIRESHPLLPVVIATGYATVETAIAALRTGAADFLRKPFSAEDYLQVVERTLRFGALSRRNAELERRAHAEKLRLRARQYELRVFAAAIAELSVAVRPVQVAECWLRAAARLAGVARAAVLTAPPERELLLLGAGDGLADAAVAAIALRAPRVLGDRTPGELRVSRVLAAGAPAGGSFPEERFDEVLLLGPEADPCAAAAIALPGRGGAGRGGAILRGLAAAAGQVLEKLRALSGEARLREAAMVAGMHQGVLLADPQGRVLVVNEAARALLGHPGAAELGDLARLEAQRGLPMGSAVAELVRSGAETRVLEFALRGPAERILNLDLTAIRDEGGRTIAVVGLLRDITELRETERMKTEFVTIVSHELRTPLTSIKTCHSLLLGGGTGAITPSQERFLRIAEAGVGRIVRLVDDLLDVARIESGAVPLNCERVDLGALLRGVGNEVEHLLHERGLRLAFTGLDAPLVVEADPERLRQVFYNIIQNAVKFSPAGGTIELRAPPPGGEEQPADAFVEVQVVDEGAGIAPGDRERIFERFQQLEGTLRREHGGVGLGLPISRGIVRSHGGEILVAGRPGGGSIFRVLLPREAAAGRPQGFDCLKPGSAVSTDV